MAEIDWSWRKPKIREPESHEFGWIPYEALRLMTEFVVAECTRIFHGSGVVIRMPINDKWAGIEGKWCEDQRRKECGRQKSKRRAQRKCWWWLLLSGFGIKKNLHRRRLQAKCFSLDCPQIRLWDRDSPRSSLFGGDNRNYTGRSGEWGKGGEKARKGACCKTNHAGDL